MGEVVLTLDADTGRHRVRVTHTCLPGRSGPDRHWSRERAKSRRTIDCSRSRLVGCFQGSTPHGRAAELDCSATKC